MKGYYSKHIPAEVFLKHRDYFEDSLIALLERQKKQIDKKIISEKAYLRKIDRQKGIIEAQKRKIRDQEAIIYNLRTKSDDAEMSIEELLKKVSEIQEDLRKDIQKYAELNSELEKENQRLKDELQIYQKNENKRKKRADSSNSNMPPSFDVFKANANSRRKSDKKRGGQKNHPVHRSDLNDKPDKIITLMVKKAPSGAVKKIDDKGQCYYAVQEIDASFRVCITETRFLIDEENGTEVDQSVMQKYRINPVSYSDHTKSMMLYLNGKGIIAFDRQCEMMNALSEGRLSIKPSTVVNWLDEFSARSEEVRKQILDNILTSNAVHVDESGLKVSGKQCWGQTITNGKDTYYMLTMKRGDPENGPLDLLKDYSHNLIHDHFIPYYTYLPHAIHCECNDHIRRYLKAGIDFSDSITCGKMITLLLKATERKKELIAEGKTCMEEEELQKISVEYEHIIDEELKTFDQVNPNIPKKYVPDYIRTLKRMKKYESEHLRFLTDFEVPFTNNPAENSIRFLKSKKKISGQFINLESGNNYLALQTVIRTATMKNQNVLQEIEKIMAA